ncbi:uncharacterized protein MYCGRDRAFT_97797 [Zymoseptoria tritici IPO323]|uniref:Uncharacterized protein n=1 Tax=Zymoseptoria tritici (strain CBS 115943 / IPO323) TaxID=336722 RepID=F9XRE5_ZYMTI|nr:uncharacterized protein MYCGRDRAFT_97797 [Zymoseptoria tritici IPO323]EGP82123.1 hypothetical protein MYCGRDRAFT_97797 [Zymoseptoria tritici IPO323]
MCPQSRISLGVNLSMNQASIPEWTYQSEELPRAFEILPRSQPLRYLDLSDEGRDFAAVIFPKTTLGANEPSILPSSSTAQAHGKPIEALRSPVIDDRALLITYSSSSPRTHHWSASVKQSQGRIGKIEGLGIENMEGGLRKMQVKNTMK